LKNLQDFQKESLNLTTPHEFNFISRRPPEIKSIILLLHGLDERGLRIYRKLIRFLPQDAWILAPDGPFPLPRVKSEKIDYGFYWYYFNRFTQNYDVPPETALHLLTGLLEKASLASPINTPIKLIGFSQGGYLAPALGYRYPGIKEVIGIGCEFRAHLFQDYLPFKLTGLHGDRDHLVPVNSAYQAIQELRQKGFNVDWHSLAGVAHEISPEVGQKIQEILEH
jgi:predicted esterase